MLMGYDFCTPRCLVPVLPSPLKTTTSRGTKATGWQCERLCRGPSAAWHFPNYSQWSVYFYPALTTGRSHHHVYKSVSQWHTRCFDTFALEFWLQPSIWHVLRAVLGKCCHIKQTSARLAPYVQKSFSITFLKICVWAVKNHTALYCEVTQHCMREFYI